MNEKVTLLRNADWGNIYKQLVAKTEGRIDKFSWRTNTYPKGHTAESLVQEAIESVLNNTSNWDPERGSLEMYLWWIIKRNLNHLYNSKTYHPEDIYEESFEQVKEDEWKIDQIELKAQATYPNPSGEFIIDGENTDEDAELKIIALLESCDNRPELKDIVYAIYEGRCSPKANVLAQFLDRPVKTIYLQLRALRSRANKIKQDFERQTDE